MNILIDGRHPPYCYDLCRALKGMGEISLSYWNTIYRPVPDGAEIISTEEASERTFDLVITDDMQHPFKAANAILVSHLELSEITTRHKLAHLKFDRIVTPSESKTTTWRYLASSGEVSTIPICVARGDYDGELDYRSTIVGTCHNGLSDSEQYSDNWFGLSRGFDAVQIGQGTESVFGERVIKPNSWEEYKIAMRSLGVFVHCMEGNVCGYTPREAMAMGIPVVTAIVPELFRFAFHGWDIAQFRGPCSKAYPEMREWIQKLIDSADLREEMGTNGRDSIFRIYPMELFVQGWRDLVNGL